MNMTNTTSSSPSFSMVDRLVWYRHHVDTDDKASRYDGVEYVPAIYYASHQEMIEQLRIGNNNTNHIDTFVTDPMLKVTLTMQFVQEQLHQQSIPLVQIIVGVSSTNPAKKDSNSPQTLDLRTVPSGESGKNRIQFDFFQHLIHMNHVPVSQQQPSSSSSFSKQSNLYSPQHLQAVYQLLQQEQQQQQQDSPPLSTSQYSSEAQTTTHTSTTGVPAITAVTPKPNDIRTEQLPPPAGQPHRPLNTMTHRVSLDGGNSPKPPSTVVATTVKRSTPEIPTNETSRADANHDHVGFPENSETLVENLHDNVENNSANENDTEQDPTEPALLKIEANDTLSILKQKLLQFGGWTYRCMDVYPKLVYYWIRPHCSVDTGRPNIDYYTNDTQLIQYLQSVYPHWQGGKRHPPSPASQTSQEEEDSDEDVSRVSRTRAQRRSSSPDLPTLESDQDQNHNDYDEVEEEEESNMPSSYMNNMTDMDENESDDEDEEEPVEFTQASPKKSAPKHKSKATSKKHITSQVNRGGRMVQRGAGKPEKVKAVPKKKRQPYASEMITPKRTKKTNWKSKVPPRKQSSLHWWKNENIPSVQQIRPILQKIGFMYDEETRQYQFPSHIRNPNRHHDVLAMGYNGLRKFLCCYGIPPSTKLHDTSKRSSSWWSNNLSDKQQEVLRRWIVFANVPTTSHSATTTTKQALRNIGSPKKQQDLITKLYTLGFSTVDGKLFVPEYKQMIDYQENPKPIHEKHYFYLDTELYTKVRWYIRQSWHLGVVTVTNDGNDSSDRLEKYHIDQERIRNNRKYYETLLFVRLWAAASSQSIPEYTSLPEDIYLEPYLRMPDDDDDIQDTEDTEEEEGVDVDDTSTNLSDTSSTSSAPTASTGVVDVQDDDDEEATANDSPVALTSPETSVTSIESDYSSENYDNDPEWYLYRPLPDFVKTIWPILVKLRFHFRSGMYGHPDVSEPIGNSNDVRKFCVRNGIPNYDSHEALTTNERQLLQRWAAFAHVDVRQSNSIQELRNVKRLDTKQILKLLTTLKFQLTDNKIYIPGADYMVGGRSNRKQGVHYFLGMEGIRGYIRGAPDLCEITTKRRRFAEPTISREDMLALRLWAALSEQPLPTFQMIKCEPGGRKKNDIIDVDDDDSSNVLNDEDKDIIAPLKKRNGSNQQDVEAAPLRDDTNADGQNWHTPSQGSSGIASTSLLKAVTKINQPLFCAAVENNITSQVLQGTENNSIPETTSPKTIEDIVAIDDTILFDGTKLEDLTDADTRDLMTTIVVVPSPHDKEVDVAVPQIAIHVNKEGQNWGTPSQGSASHICSDAVTNIDQQPVLNVPVESNKMFQVADVGVSEPIPVRMSTSTNTDRVEKDDMVPRDATKLEDLSTTDTRDNVKRDIHLATATVVVPAPKRLRRTSFESVLEKACVESDQDDDIVKVDHYKNHNLSTQDEYCCIDEDDDESRQDGPDFTDLTTQDDMEDEEIVENIPTMHGRRASINQLPLFTQFDMEEDDDDEEDHDGEVDENNTMKQNANGAATADADFDFPPKLYEPEDWGF